MFIIAITFLAIIAKILVYKQMKKPALLLLFRGVWRGGGEGERILSRLCGQCRALSHQPEVMTSKAKSWMLNRLGHRGTPVVLLKCLFNFGQEYGLWLLFTCVSVCQVKYKEGWEKAKGKGFEMKLDAMSLLAAKASGELASNVGFLSLTQRCIRNDSPKMSVVLRKK